LTCRFPRSDVITEVGWCRCCTDLVCQNGQLVVDKAHQGPSGRGEGRRGSRFDQGEPHVPDFPDHARLLPTVFTTTERPRNDLEDLVTSPTRPPIISDNSRLFWTIQNSREHLDRVRRPPRTLPDQPPTFPDHQGRPPSRLSVTRALVNESVPARMLVVRESCRLL